MTTELIIDDDHDELTTVEADELRELESCIEANVRGFVEVGTALEEIRDRRLYRGEFETFDVYLKERWQFSRSYASRLIGAAETVQMLPQGNSLPSAVGEKHLRPLLQFPAEHRGAVWERVTRCYGDSPSAREVEQFVRSDIATSNEEPFKSVRLEQKRLRRERLNNHKERKSTETAKGFDVEMHSSRVREQMEFYESLWPAEHHATLADLLRRAADEIESQ